VTSDSLRPSAFGPRPDRQRLWNLQALLGYTAIAVVMTWPLVTRLGREIASDLGDPVFNSWVMMWTGGQVLAALGGHWNAFHLYWHGNIFAPEPLSIAYSEHLTPQMLQILPLYAATGNIVLCYNLLFLSTFVLAGFGTYLLVRDLTGRPLGAFLAGLAFAFAPYRISQYSHLQVLSTYWMPLTLFGLHRYFRLCAERCGETSTKLEERSRVAMRRTRPLVGGAAALALQNLSCGYYMLFFVPFAAAYSLFEMTRRGLLRDVRTWASLGAALLGVAIVTWPFVSPYLEVRRAADVGVRTRDEVVQFSADVQAFGTAPEPSRLWGERVRVYPKGEGEGFPGFAILALAVAGLLSGRVRASGQRTRADAIFFGLAALAGGVLAFGPVIRFGGQDIATGPYALLFTYVPGFDGVRVPARYLMIVALFLAILAGFGAAALVARRSGVALAAVAAAVMLAESWVAPMPTNVRMAPYGFELTPRQLRMGGDISPIYQWARDAPGKIVLIEFPFAEPAYDILATFYAGQHRRPLVNGYSGFFPEAYLRRATFLRKIPSDLEAATKALRSSGATHAIVHEGAIPDGRGHELSDWLLSIGAQPVMTHGTDKLFVIR
jgi:hypothetical protein